MEKLIEHITGKRLMERWNNDEHELRQKVQKGLFAYEPCDAFEPQIIADKYRKIGIDISSFDFKPDYTDGSGSPFRCVFPESDEEIPSLIFKLSDVESFEKELGQDLGPYSTLEQVQPSEDVDTFIRSLRISYENDNEIKIQLPGQKAKCFTCESLGFRDNETKTWKDLTNILQFRPHTFDVGAAYEHLFYDSNFSHQLLHGEIEEEGGSVERYTEIIKTKDYRINMYDRRRKRLSEINKKLTNFFHKEYSIRFPKTYKLYELTEEDGVYEFKFLVILDDGIIVDYDYGFEKYSKDQLLQEIKSSAQKYHRKCSKVFHDRFTTAIKIALDKKWITNHEIKNMIKE